MQGELRTVGLARPEKAEKPGGRGLQFVPGALVRWLWFVKMCHARVGRICLRHFQGRGPQLPKQVADSADKDSLKTGARWLQEMQPGP